MVNAHDQAPQNPTTPDKQDGGGSSTISDSFRTIFPIVLGGAFIIGLSLAFLILWLNRRRQRRNKANSATNPNPNQKDNEAALIESDASRSSHETNVCGAGGGGKSSWLGSTTRRRLQKACSVGGAGPGVWSKVGVCGGENDDGEGRGWPRRHMSAPLIPWPCSKGHFHFGLGPRSESCRWPDEEGGTEMGEVTTGGVCKVKKSWIDEDALHGPRVSSKEKEEVSGLGWRRKKKTEERDSWPLRNRTPTLPRMHHTVHGYPYVMSGARGGESSEALLGEGSEQTPANGMDHARLRAFSRVMPEAPRPALVANRDRRVIKPSVTMGYVYGASRIPMPLGSPPANPTRSAPNTPSRHRGRQRSTDSTLTEILRSTEQRLREGSVSETVRSGKVTASSTRASSPAKVLDSREFETSGSRSRTPSPKKIVSGQSSTAGHQRQDSPPSVSSEKTDSLVGDECPNPDIPSGLTSPSRNQKKPEAERPPVQGQSVRTSLSSELSTLYSEDEMPEEVKRAIMPLGDLIVQPQQAAKVRPPAMNNPFVTTPPALSVSRSSSVGGWPAEHSKSQVLLQLGVQRSQRLRSMTAGHARSKSQGLISAPGHIIQAAKPSAMMPVSPPSHKVSATTAPPSIQPSIASRASEPRPTPSRPSSTSASPSGPLFLRVTKTSTLSTMPQLPPPAAPAFESLKEASSEPASPSKTPSDQQQQQPTQRSPVLMLPSTERSPAPPAPTRRVGGELRLSIILPPKQLQDPHNQNRNSASSSLYSQDTNSHPNTSPQPKSAIELNRAGFAANSSLYPAPLSPLNHRPALSSKLSSELTEFNDNGGKEGENGNDKNPPSENENKADRNDDDNGNDDDEDTPLALTSAIASLRRMNSGVSAASSLRSIADRDGPASRDMSLSPDQEGGVPGPAARDVSFPPSGSGSAAGGENGIGPVAEGAGADIGGREELSLSLRQSLGQRDGQQHRKSIGSRNYYILGNGERRQSRRLSRVPSAGSGIVRSPSGGAGVDVAAAGAGPKVRAGSPLKRRRPGSLHHQQRASTPLLRKSSSEVAVGGEEGKENKAGDGRFNVAAGEFTFEMGNLNVSGKGPHGFREGSSGGVNAPVMPQNDSQRLSLAWKPTEGAVSRNGSPVRFGGVSSRASMRSVDSLGLYDPQGFLISATPVRGPSPFGLRV